MKYLFGPVNSRRLGISLGVDLVTHKTCSLNCVYCECGKTTQLTSEINEYTPIEDVIEELDEYLYNKPKLDVITFSGSGEPTLHSGIGKIINHIKITYPEYKVIVLTNGTLLNKTQVRKNLLKADIVIPSLDAVSEEVFFKLLRPANKITPQKVIDGIIEFRNEFNGTIILEIFIIPGINDSDDELNKLKRTCIKINPDKIHLNKLDRPGAENWIKSVSNKRLLEIKEFFNPLNVELIGDPKENSEKEMQHIDIIETIKSTLKRRPSTIDDLSQSIGIENKEIIKIISNMLEKNILIEEELERGKFYRLKKSV